MTNRENTEETRRIWNIREDIDELEKAIDAIVQLFSGSEENSSGTDSMWVADTRDLFFHVVSSWKLLKSCPSLGGDKLEECSRNVLSFLELAKDKYLQVQSELESLSGTKAKKMISQLEKTFTMVSTAISESLEPFRPTAEDCPPENIIRKDGPREFALLCAVCGSIAASFIADDGSDRIQFKGITTSTTLDWTLNHRIFDFLDEGELNDVHNHIRTNTFLEDGIDAYCPKCDKAYCRTHYSVEVVYDEGFYDCAYGTCPEGHKRIIDD